MWLWPTIMQTELDKFVKLSNNRRICKQSKKILPSGVTPDFAFTFPERYGASNCLIPVDVQIVDEILNDLKVEKEALTDWGVLQEFARKAEAGLTQMGVKEVTKSNAWIVFAALLAWV